MRFIAGLLALASIVFLVAAIITAAIHSFGQVVLIFAIFGLTLKVIDEL